MIDENSIVTIYDKKVVVGDIGDIIQGEANSQLITFEMDSEYDGVTLYDKTIKIRYTRNIAEEDSIAVDAINISSDLNGKFNFSWLLDENVCKYSGIVFAIVWIKGTTEDGKNYVLKTEPFSFNVKESIYSDVDVDLEEAESVREILDKLVALGDDLETKRDSGYFKGEKGEPGQKGDPGQDAVIPKFYFYVDETGYLKLDIDR